MKTSEAGRKFIQGFESCSLTAFHGKADRPNVWTIGWGRIHGVKQGDVCTQAQADAWFDEDLASFEKAVNDLVLVPLTQGQFNALVSFAYNVGSDIDADTVAEGLGDSTLLKKLNAGDYAGAADEFLKWNKANGIAVNGLTRRRKGEREMFLGGVA